MADISPKFSIPPEYQKDLRFSPSTDTRSDTKILDSLSKHVPVSGERNVWSYWHSGLYNMPAWQQRNVCDWARICGESWTIRVLDNEPESPSYVLKFVPKERLPPCFLKGTMDGPYKGQHSADFIRGAVLYTHGGVWSDLGQILLTSFDRICWDKLEDPNSPYRVAAPWVNGTVVSNYFVAARKGDPFIKRWHEVFCAIWEGKTNCIGVGQHPLLKNTGLKYEDLFGSKYSFELKVDNQTLFEYVSQMVCWMRICMLEGNGSDDDGDEASFNGVEYWQKHVLLFNSLEETQAAEKTTGWVDAGPKLFRLLSTKVADEEPGSSGGSISDDQRDASEVVWRLLTRSSVQKVARGSNITVTPNLGTFWDMPENRGKDVEPGTFAELLRYGSVNFEQTRDEPVYVVDPPRPDRTLRKGHLEP